MNPTPRNGDRLPTGRTGAGSLLGYSLPLSPSGTSSMLTPPPWHFAGEAVMVDFRVDPDAARRFLPPGLELGPDPGAAAAVFAFWQWCSEGEAELADPVRAQFAEFLILLDCQFAGRPMARCPYAWVDQPVPMVRGWVQGMPKQLGAIHLTRAMQVGRSAVRLTEGGRFAGTASVFGHRLAEATVTLEGVAQEPPPLHTVPLVHTLTFPRWAATDPPTADLVVSEVSDVAFSTVWTGPATLRLHDVLDGDFASLAPVEVGSGWVFSYAETLHGGRLLTAL